MWTGRPGGERGIEIDVETCLMVFFVPRYCITEVREVIRTPPIFARSVISASVRLSAKYCCSGSRERLSSGMTARAEIGGGLLLRVDSQRAGAGAAPCAAEVRVYVPDYFLSKHELIVIHVVP
jgi:hypothetical protein